MNTRTIEVIDAMTVEQFISELAGLTYGSGDPEKIFARIQKPSTCKVHYNEDNKILAWLTHNIEIPENDPE